MFKKTLLILSILIGGAFSLSAQDIDSTKKTTLDDASKEVKAESQSDEKTEDQLPTTKPDINYNTSRRYEIADIAVSGISESMYEDYVLISFSGLSVGDKIEVPGPEVTNAIKRFWKQGLFSNVKITASKIEGNKIWLDIYLEERPRVSDLRFSGMKGGERKDLQQKMGIVKNLQITPNQLDNAKNMVKKYFDEKGFNKAVINITQTPDLSKENHVFLDIDVAKKNKTKVNAVNITGNIEVASHKLEATMKKTRHKSGLRAWLRNFLRSTNYVPESYEDDKNNLINKYNELGYRDALILWDTVYTDEKNTNKVNIDIKVEEGAKYHLRDVKWVGNTEHPTWDLERGLGMKKGDVYNQTKLVERLSGDDDAVMNYFYQNDGFVFSHADPVEVNIEKDSIDLEIRITEGPRASFRHVGISGNDRLYEDVIRRELRVKPGDLYSREEIVRSLREIMQMGHFDPENLQPDVQPDPDAGVVDLTFALTSKANDQIEFSAGWGQTGVIGRLSLRFSNFSIRNLFNPSTYKGFLPQGDGQTLTLSGQTNGRYYQAYSMSFFDPWFGGKRPNSFSVSASYSRQTDISSRYRGNMFNSIGGGGYYPGGGGWGGGDMGLAADPNTSFEVIGLAVGYGKRLSWPDDYFQFQAELQYEIYKMKNWQYFLVKDGTCNSISLNLSLMRNSMDNPLYTRRGSEFFLGLEITPPHSLWDGRDYKNMKSEENSPFQPKGKFKWIEYHKWKMRSKVFIPLSDAVKTPVLMTRFEFGYVGYFNKHKKSPFGAFYMGGDGMSGYADNYATETVGLRGYENGAIAYQASAYTKVTLEFRYPLILEPSSTIYLLGFLEGGNGWEDLGSINPFDLKRSAGLGVRIHLPMVGLMGIDWAYGFDAIKGSRKDSGSQFHFILGQEF